MPKMRIIFEILRKAAVAANPAASPPALAEPATSTTVTTFQMNSMKLYVPVVTLYINNNIIFLEHLNQGFKRKISCNKYRSEITTEHKSNNLD